MAKQRRARPKSTGRKRRPPRVAPRSGLVHPQAPLPPTERHPPASSRRPSYPEAVALYEKGLQALQRRDFRLAHDTFQAVLDKYPEERELHDRARLYLRVCERETEPPPPPPQTSEERVYAATIALNAGRYEEALEELRAVSAQDPENDHAQYMLAVAYAARRDAAAALTHLRRAIELNPENRVLARQEADFDPIRDYDGFRQALEVPAQAPRRRGRGRITH